MRGSTTRRQILLSRETLLGLVVVMLLAGVCVLLGLWQFDRYEARAAQAEVVRANYDTAPVALDEVLPELTAPLAAAQEWKPVTLHGSYCTTDDCVLYVRNRQLSGRVGFWQLAPFRADDGTTVLVVRGWVPSAGDASQPADPAPVPEGDRSVTVRMRPAEPVLDREPPPGQTHSVNPRQSAGLMGIEDARLVTGAYGELATEEPAAERPEPLPSPDTSLGPHLSYAVQWWVFALFFPAALIYRTRRQLQDLADEEQEADAAKSGVTDSGVTDTATAGTDTPRTTAGPSGTARTDPDQTGASEPAAVRDERTGTAPPARRRPDLRPRRTVSTRRRGHDEEEEDALIDRQQS